MSTRCQLIIWDYVPETDDFKRRLNFYHHDGYPSYMEKDIKEVLKKAPDFKISTLEKLFQEYDSEYELEDLRNSHGDIEYVWHLFISDDKAELKYVKIEPKMDIDKALEDPEAEWLVDSWTVFHTDHGLDELMQLEMDNELDNKMAELAKKFNMSVGEYCSKTLTEAYKSGLLQKFVDDYIEKHKDLKNEDKD